MDAGTKVWKAYIFDGKPGDYYLMEAIATGITVDGVEMVRRGTTLMPLCEGWCNSMIAAKREAHRQIVRDIGKAQAKADALADEILHDELTTEGVAA